MKILLTIPIINNNLSKSGGANYYTPHLGLAYLAAYLISKGIEVKIFDGIINPSYKKYYQVLKKFQPDWLGLTAMTSQIKSVYQMIDYSKILLPKIKIVLGGVHASALPKETLQECKNLDCVIIGEGEKALYKLLTFKNKDWFKIPGVAYRRANGVVINPAKIIETPDKLPFPAWQLFELKKYTLPGYKPGLPKSGLKELPVLTGRGCPFRCTFCAHGLGSIPRLRSVKNIIQEILYLHKTYKISSIAFYADTFTLYPEFIKKLCKQLIKNNLNKKISWGCATRIDKLDLELMKLMKAAGCIYILIGIENGDQKILDQIKKGFTLKKAERIIKQLNQVGILIYATFILGLPGETVSSVNKTINYALSLPIDYASFAVFTPFPGTPIFEEISKLKNCKIRTRDWNKYQTQNGEYLLEQKGLNSKQISWLHKKAYFKFYFRRKYIFRLWKVVNLSTIINYLLRSINIFKK